MPSRSHVTGTNYTEFLAAKAGDMSGQSPACSSNASYEPTVAKNGEFPVFGVDWCDALAYCSWAGKRLCGKIGGGGVPRMLVDNAFSDEWYRACSMDGTREWPYGNTRNSNACNGSDHDGGGGRQRRRTGAGRHAPRMRGRVSRSLRPERESLGVGRLVRARRWRRRRRLHGPRLVVRIDRQHVV